MATNPYVNKVVYGDQTVIDISDTTASEADVAAGEVFYKGSGARSVGTADYYSPSDTAETAIDDADYFPYYDTSATAKRKSLWSNIKSVLKTYFVSLFVIEKTKAQYDALPSADKNDPDKVYYVPDYEDTSKTWVALDDTTTAIDKVWSSSKVSTELGNVAQIDDTTTSGTKAWSSTKIQTEINGKLAYSENDATGTVIDDADFVPYYDYSESARQKITFANIKAKLKTYFDSLYAAISHTHTKSQITDFPTLATVATSGSYNDLSNKPTIPAAQIQSDWNQTDTSELDYIKNKPTIPAAQVNSDWNASSGVAEILNKPTLATVATTGDYDDLTDAPAVENPSSGGTTRSLVTTGEKYKWNNGVVLHTIFSYLSIEVNAGNSKRFPSSGTDSRITPTSKLVPFATTINGRPVKYSSVEAFDGYATITFAETLTSSMNITVTLFVAATAN